MSNSTTKSMPKQLKNKPDLSIIVVSYNTKELLKNCLDSVKKYSNRLNLQILVSDNGSTDGSVKLVKNNYKKVILIENKDNLGFAKGNNAAKKLAKSNYILFLNSDTQIHKDTLKTCLSYIKQHKNIGALSCKVLLRNGEFDKDTTRSFPTPWVALTHFTYLDRIFPSSEIFSKYWYSYEQNLNKTREVDVVQGAFNMMPKKVLDKIGWFDEDYFLDGEDIDLCWKIKKAGYKVIYYPKTSITHVKKASKKGKKSLKSIMAGVNAMEIFYKKRLFKEYPLFVNYSVLIGIKILKTTRLLKFYLR